MNSTRKKHHFWFIKQIISANFCDANHFSRDISHTQFSITIHHRRQCYSAIWQSSTFKFHLICDFQFISTQHFCSLLRSFRVEKKPLKQRSGSIHHPPIMVCQIGICFCFIHAFMQRYQNKISLKIYGKILWRMYLKIFKRSQTLNQHAWFYHDRVAIESFRYTHTINLLIFDRFVYAV